MARRRRRSYSSSSSSSSSESNRSRRYIFKIVEGEEKIRKLKRAIGKDLILLLVAVHLQAVQADRQAETGRTTEEKKKENKLKSEEIKNVIELTLLNLLSPIKLLTPFKI